MALVSLVHVIDRTASLDQLATTAARPRCRDGEGRRLSFAAFFFSLARVLAAEEEPESYRDAHEEQRQEGGQIAPWTSLCKATHTPGAMRKETPHHRSRSHRNSALSAP